MIHRVDYCYFVKLLGWQKKQDPILWCSAVREYTLLRSGQTKYHANMIFFSLTRFTNNWILRNDTNAGMKLHNVRTNRIRYLESGNTVNASMIPTKKRGVVMRGEIEFQSFIRRIFAPSSESLRHCQNSQKYSQSRLCFQITRILY